MAHDERAPAREQAPAAEASETVLDRERRWPRAEAPVLGGCEGACDFLACHLNDAEHLGYHDQVVRVLSGPEVEGLAWLLGELGSAGQLDGPELWPAELAGFGAQHNLPHPVFVHRIVVRLAGAYTKRQARQGERQL